MKLTSVVYQLRMLARDLRAGARTMKLEGADEAQIHLVNRVAGDLAEEAEFFFKHVKLPHVAPLKDHYYEPVGVRWKRVFRIRQIEGQKHCVFLTYRCPHHTQAACTLGTARGDKPEQCPGFSVVKLEERKD